LHQVKLSPRWQANEQLPHDAQAARRASITTRSRNRVCRSGGPSGGSGPREAVERHIGDVYHDFGINTDNNFNGAERGVWEWPIADPVPGNRRAACGES
jgi:hypothetical protein